MHKKIKNIYKTKTMKAAYSFRQNLHGLIFGNSKTPLEKSESWNIWKKTIIGVLPALVFGATLGKYIEEYLFNKGQFHFYARLSQISYSLNIMLTKQVFVFTRERGAEMSGYMSIGVTPQQLMEAMTGEAQARQYYERLITMAPNPKEADIIKHFLRMKRNIFKVLVCYTG